MVSSASRGDRIERVRVELSGVESNSGGDSGRVDSGGERTLAKTHTTRTDWRTEFDSQTLMQTGGELGAN